MAENSGFWTTNGTGDGALTGYTMNDWRDLINNFFLAAGKEASGSVVKGSGNELACTGAVSPIAVNTGRAIIQGFWYENTTSTNAAVTTPVVGTTGGHVVLRASWATQQVRIVAVRNTDGVNSTPALTQVDGTTWEVRLCLFTITTGGVITVTDTRQYLGQDTIDDVMIGNRVIGLTRRQGGNASDWSIAGTTTYTPTMVREQVGVFAHGSTIAAGAFGGGTINFPTAFSQPPNVELTPLIGGNINAVITGVGATQFSYRLYNNDSGGFNPSCMWRAVGPE